MATAAEIQTAYKALYRVDLNATVAASIAGSGISLDAYIAGQLPSVASTTQAAVAIASFVTGIAPTSAKLDDLKVAADAQVASYTKLGVANPALGAFEAFGRSFATDTTTTAAFTAKYGALSTADFIGVVYGSVYGASPTAAAAANLTAQIDYFTALFTANNVANASIAAKGAVLGQIVGYAFVSSASANSNLDNQVQSLLTSAGKGDATVYGKALPVVVDPGTVGVTIQLTGGADVVSTTSAEPSLKSTGNNDTVNAAAGNFTNGDKIDTSTGADTLTAILNAAVTLDQTAATKVTMTGVEVVKIDGNLAANIFDAKGAVGVTDFIATNLDATSGATVFTNIASGIALGVEKNDGAVTFGFGTTAIASAEVKLTSASNTITLGDAVAGLQSGATAVTLNALTNTTAVMQLEDATSVKIIGAGNTNLSFTGAANINDKLATIDASASTGKVGLTLNSPLVNTTVTLSAQDDIFASNVASLKLVTVATGAGADRVAVSPALGLGNASFNGDGSLKTGLVVSDFTKGTDKVDLTAANLGTIQALSAGALTAINAATTVENAFKAAITDLAVSKFAVFAYGADTYVVGEGSVDGLGVEDVIVKVTGVTGVTIGAGVANDFLTV